MRKILFFTFSLFIFFTSFISCSGVDIQVEGKFGDDTNNGKHVYLQTINLKSAGKINMLDSAIVENGKFTLKTDIKDIPAIGFISVGKMDELIAGEHQNPMMATIVLERGKIEVNFDKSTYTLGGTQRNKELNNVVAVMNKANKLQQEASVVDNIEGVQPEERKQDIMSGMQELGKEMQNEVYNFLKSNMKNKAGEFMFYSSGSMLAPEQMKELLQLADTSFVNMPEIKDLKNLLDNQASSIDEISLTDISGNKVKLSDYVGKGKYVLVDFWATWCGPCMNEMPALKKIYSIYKSKDFEIIGISLDDDMEAWKSTVKSKGMNWIQLHDTDKNAGMYYKVSSIPFTILFGKDGNIIEMNLQGNNLEQKLKDTINK